MEVVQQDDIFAPKMQFKRYWQTQLWKPMFHKIMNEGVVSLEDIRLSFEQYLVKKKENVKSLLLKQASEFRTYMNNK